MGSPDSGEQTVVLAAGLAADVDIRGHTLYATVNALPGPGGPPDGHVMYVELKDGRPNSVRPDIVWHT